ncbi:MAG: hypothetical protein WD844_06830 [Thermoleophilaceae bacterium]
MGLRAARHIDVLVLVLALALFLATGITMVGWAIGAGAWAAQRIVQALIIRRAEAAPDPRTTVGLMAGGMIVRGWLAAGIIFGVGLATTDEAGLSGALLFIATFTLWFTSSMIVRSFDDVPPREAGR